MVIKYRLQLILYRFCYKDNTESSAKIQTCTSLDNRRQNLPNCTPWRNSHVLERLLEEEIFSAFAGKRVVWPLSTLCDVSIAVLTLVIRTYWHHRLQERAVLYKKGRLFYSWLRWAAVSIDACLISYERHHVQVGHSWRYIDVCRDEDMQLV